MLHHTETMEIAGLILEYLKALAWPLTVVTLAFIFRKAISGVLSRLVSAKAMGMSFELQDQARKLAEEAEEMPELAEASPLPEPEPETSHDTKVGQFLKAWVRLETTAAETARRLNLTPAAGRNLGVLANQLSERNLISKQTADVARSLQRLRNEIVHHVNESILTEFFVDDFMGAVGNIEKVLRSIPSEHGDTPS